MPLLAPVHGVGSMRPSQPAPPAVGRCRLQCYCLPPLCMVACRCLQDDIQDGATDQEARMEDEVSGGAATLTPASRACDVGLLCMQGNAALLTLLARGGGAQLQQASQQQGRARRAPTKQQDKPQQKKQKGGGGRQAGRAGRENTRVNVQLYGEEDTRWRTLTQTRTCTGALFLMVLVFCQ